MSERIDLTRKRAAGMKADENTALCKKSGLPCAQCMRGVLDDVTQCPSYQAPAPKEKEE